MSDHAADRESLARLACLVGVVELEALHLEGTDGRLFSTAMTTARATSMATNAPLAEQVDAFVARFGRLQDTIADKLLPTLLEQMAEPVGAVIDNLARAERFGWIRSTDQWLAVRKLRNRMIHEYVRDPEVLAGALAAAHVAVPMLLATARALVGYAKERFELPAEA